MSRLNQIDTRPKFITAEEVFQQTNGGLDIFRRELSDFTTTANVRNVLVDSDRNPSSRVKQSSTSGLWLFKVYNAGGGCYNAIQFIQKRYNLSFKEAINYIVNQQHLTPVIEHKPIKIVKKEPIFYEVETQPFTKQHTDYYCIGGLTEEFLNKEMDIYAVKKWSSFKKVYEPNEGQFMFVYIFRDKNGNIVPGKMKFLTLGPNVDKKRKWKNTVEPQLVHFEYKLDEKEEFVFVVKSVKDACITQFCNITSVAVTSENYHNIKAALENLIKKYPQKTFILNLGSDIQALETSLPLSREFNLSWFNIPKKFLSMDCNDNFSYCHNFGINSFKQLLKNKKYL